MHTSPNSRLRAIVAASAALASLQGCIVYRDRFISVRSEVDVELRGGTPSSLQSRSLGAVTELAPSRLDQTAMRAALDAYGEWVDHPAYGMVWVPGIQNSREFMPYGTDGQWRLTNAGWYWQSSLAWGQVAFHYGRWVMIERLWAWVPGSAFAPAWVDWRQGNGWVGWSPLPPLGATYTSPFTYCTCSGLAGAGLWGRVIRGAPATSLYARTAAISPAYGYGGTVYVWGPSAESTGTVPAAVETLGTVHRQAVAAAVEVPPPAASPRTGAPDGVGTTVALGRPVGAPIGSLSDVPSVITSAVPATGALRELSSFPAYSSLHAGDPTRIAESALPPPPGRIRDTISLGTSLDVGRVAAPTARVATWERFNGASPSSGAQSFAPSGISRVASAPSSYFDAPSTIAATRPLLGPSYPSNGGFVPRAPTSFGAVPAPSSFNATSAPVARVAPLYTPPSYAPPSYAPVARPYAAPSYAAPSYAAPSYYAAPAAPVYRAAPVMMGGAGVGSAVRFNP